MMTTFFTFWYSSLLHDSNPSRLSSSAGSAVVSGGGYGTRPLDNDEDDDVEDDVGGKARDADRRVDGVHDTQ